MKSQLFVPSKIKVGFQHREDTYTKRLGYVIYYGPRGDLRKEISWRGWIHDKPMELSRRNEQGVWERYEAEALPTPDYENIPTEGFVLNKGAGGHAGSSSSWNIRRETVRVWDPRDFEFEISVKNLLFILENTNSYKGKGLEGKFVYAWDGKDLVLLPEACQEYKESVEFTGLKSKKVGIKELVEGGVYYTKSQEKWIYLGKLDYFTFNHPQKDGKKGRYNLDYQTQELSVQKAHIFVDESGNYQVETGGSKLAEVISDVPVDNYAEIIDNYYKSKWGSKPVGLRFEPGQVEFSTYEQSHYNDTPLKRYAVKAPLFSFNVRSNKYTMYNIAVKESWDETSRNDNGQMAYNRMILNGYTAQRTRSISFDEKKGIVHKVMNNDQSKYSTYSYTISRAIVPKYETEQDILDLNLGELFVILESGTEVPYEKYKQGYY